MRAEGIEDLWCIIDGLTPESLTQGTITINQAVVSEIRELKGH